MRCLLLYRVALAALKADLNRDKEVMYSAQQMQTGVDKHRECSLSISEREFWMSFAAHAVTEVQGHLSYISNPAPLSNPEIEYSNIRKRQGARSG